MESIVDLKPNFQYIEADKDIYKFSGNVETSKGMEELNMK